MSHSFGHLPTRLSSAVVRLAAGLAFTFVFLAPVARAQNHGGGPGGGPPGGSGGSFGGTNSNFSSNSNGSRNASTGVSRDESRSTVARALQLGPPGRWWDDAKFAKSLNLDSVQQHHMDDIFNASKGNLVNLYDGLRHEEAELEKLTRARTPDESQIDQQIDRVTSARSILEKATAHTLLELRKQLTEDQIGRLEDHRAS